MPGTSGFTMACFRAADIPVGTKLYAAPGAQPAPTEPLTTTAAKTIFAELGCDDVRVRRNGNGIQFEALVPGAKIDALIHPMGAWAGLLQDEPGQGARQLMKTYPACKGTNCGATDGVSHSLECKAEHDALVGPELLNTPGNRHPEDRYDGYKGRPLRATATADQLDAWCEGRTAAGLAATPEARMCVREVAADAKLRMIFSHWNEFGPESGFGELMDRLQGEVPAEPLQWEEELVPEGERPADGRNASLRGTANGIMRAKIKFSGAAFVEPEPISLPPGIWLVDVFENKIRARRIDGSKPPATEPVKAEPAEPRIARLESELAQAKQLLGEECSDVDRVLRELGLDPEAYRTDGGRLRVSSAVDALAQAGAAVPAGWKLVPEDATDEMVDATYEGQPLYDLWRDMLAAAPNPPASASMKCPHCTDGTMHERRSMVCDTCDGAGVMRHQLRANAASARNAELTDERIDYIADLVVKGMPDGIQGFLKSWGWRQFARAIIEDCSSVLPATPSSAHSTLTDEQFGHLTLAIDTFDELSDDFDERGHGSMAEGYRARAYQLRQIAALLATASSADARDAAPTAAARDVLAERARQISVEGWTPEHDDEHDYGELSRAAAAYALFAASTMSAHPGVATMLHRSSSEAWPWEGPSKARASSERRNLIKAGALILAEVERLDRAAIAAEKGGKA